MQTAEVTGVQVNIFQVMGINGVDSKLIPHKLNPKKDIDKDIWQKQRVQ